MTVDEVKAAAAALAAQITDLCQKFEADTQCKIHSLPVSENSKPVTIRVKVQIG